MTIGTTGINGITGITGLATSGTSGTGGLPPHRGGLGTAAAALAETTRPARTLSALYCPTAVRDDPALAARVQDGLQQWAADVGMAPDSTAGLGRLAVLTHPDTDDPRRLQAAARLLALGRVAERGDTGAAGPVVAVATATTGGVPEGVVAAAVPGGGIEAIFDGCDHAATAAAATIAALIPADAITGGAATVAAAAVAAPPVIADPVLLSTLATLTALPASPHQVDRVRREYQTLSSSAPTRSGPHPPWEHLALAHLNAYSPVLAALDTVDGYELTPAAAAHPDLRRAQRLAALAAALLRDLAHPGPGGLTAAIARADGLGTPAAARRAAAVHDDAMRAFQHHATHLAAGPDPAIRRYLAGLWTWLGGHRTWNTQP